MRQPLAMTNTLLQDLVQYRKSKDKAVMMAAKGLLGLYREVGPEMLRKRDRGKDAAMGIKSGERTERRFGETGDGGIEGLELLEKWKAEEEQRKREEKGVGSDDGDGNEENEDEDDSAAWEIDSEDSDADSGGWINADSEGEVELSDSDDDEDEDEDGPSTKRAKNGNDVTEDGPVITHPTNLATRKVRSPQYPPISHQVTKENAKVTSDPHSRRPCQTPRTQNPSQHQQANGYIEA